MLYTIEILQELDSPLIMEHEFDTDPTTAEVCKVVTESDIDLSDWNGDIDYYPARIANQKHLPEYLCGSGIIQDVLIGTATSQVLYTESELVSFGEYLLSDKRKEYIREHSRQIVHHADLSNWKELIKRNSGGLRCPVDGLLL